MLFAVTLNSCASWGSGGGLWGHTCLSSWSAAVTRKGWALGSRRKGRCTREVGGAVTPQERRPLVPLPRRRRPNTWVKLSGRCPKDKEDGHKDKDSRRWVGGPTLWEVSEICRPISSSLAGPGSTSRPSHPRGALVWETALFRTSPLDKDTLDLGAHEDTQQASEVACLSVCPLHRSGDPSALSNTATGGHVQRRVQPGEGLSPLFPGDTCKALTGTPRAQSRSLAVVSAQWSEHLKGPR